MPEATDVHVDAALSEFAMRYANPDTGLVAESVAPRVPVVKQNDKYYEWDKNNIRLVETLRHEKDGPRSIDFALSSTSYFCEDHELVHYISDEERGNADPAVDPEQDAVQFLLDVIALDRESRAASLVTSTTNITNNTTLSGTDQWSDDTNSDPFGDIKTAKLSVLESCLRQANVLIIPSEVAQTLAHHSDYLERYKYAQEAVTPSGLTDHVAGLRVIEACAYQNTAQEGQTDALGSVWGVDVLIGHIPTVKPSKKTPCGLVTFEWQPRQVRKWREEGRKCDAIAVSDGYTDIKLTGDCFFYLIKAAIATS